MVLAQLYVPVKWIYEHEMTLRKGALYKFRIEPVDPGDPFRGKYLTIDYEADSVTIEAPSKWSEGETVYVSFDTTEEGFVHLLDVSRSYPSDWSSPYFRTKVDEVHRQVNLKRGWLSFEHPFERYFIEGKKAERIEELYFEELGDHPDRNYALIRIRNGHSALEGLVINGEPVEELVKEPPE